MSCLLHYINYNRDLFNLAKIKVQTWLQNDYRL